MRRYFVASLAAGICFALMAPVFVHFVLEDTMEQELGRVVAHIMGSVPSTDAAAGTAWGQVALHMGVRVVWGFLAMGVFAFLQCKRPRFRAARIAGISFWALAYVLLPIRMHFAYGMSLALVFVCMGYGLVETQVAAHTGALAWGKKDKKEAKPAAT